MNGFIALMSILDWLQVILVDLILAGDNAIVIAIAANKLAPPYRRSAMIFGIVFALFIRIISTFGMSNLLQYDIVTFLGGLTLFYIAWKMWNDF